MEFRNEQKRNSHFKNIEVWQHLTNRKSLNASEQYWTLMDDNSFEVESLEMCEFLVRNQFHGVNLDEEKCDKCRDKFPGININHGEWCEVVRRNSPCANGGIVYLDTMCQLDQVKSTGSTLLLATLDSVGPRTLVCANYCHDNPRSRTKVISPAHFIERIGVDICNSNWEHIKFGDYDAYLPEKTNMTQMITFFFWRSK